MALYAEVFACRDALHRLEGFASLHGPAFYGLEPNCETITLIEEPQQVVDQLDYEDGSLVPFRAGEILSWSLA